MIFDKGFIKLRCKIIIKVKNYNKTPHLIGSTI